MLFISKSVILKLFIMVKNILFFGLFLILVSFNSSGQEDNSYYFSKQVDYSFEEATSRLKTVLKEQEFGVITEIDMHQKISEKIKDANMQPYRILGVCNPKFAYQTLKIEENIGLFLPCKVIIKQIDENTSEVVMVNPSALMNMLENEALDGVADEVTDRFKKALEAL